MTEERIWDQVKLKQKRYRVPLRQNFKRSLSQCRIVGVKVICHIIFEGDSRNVVNLVNNSSLNFVLFNWIREVWSWMAKFKDIAFTCVPREGNQAAETCWRQEIFQTIQALFIILPFLCS
ncbi:unnamed protein product [Microthlaspi erraticum]|uniref:RNase H type-1 domain-containing protein n=1 Tax=Microthlaspi erraticum TaxID=1685480 RepID=A0A6D2HR56_9BRAS|nr:unnamed protein product [Microthlaspi erraticum]